MRQILAICDYEEYYVSRLADYLNSHRLLPFEVMAFNDLDKLHTFTKTHQVTILLIEETMYRGESIIPLSIGEVILLTTGKETKEGIVAETLEYNALETIPKYQSAELIAKQLLEICTVSRQIIFSPPNRSRQAELIGIYSPIGRCLQTSFSIVLGQLLAQDKKCLYINLEPYSGFHSLFGKQYKQSMTDLLYFLQKGTDRFLYKLKSTVETIGKLDYIPPADSFLDLMDITLETWQLFIETLIAQTDYDVIIFDLSDYIRGVFDFLSACDHIYTIVKKDGFAMAKLEQYEQLLSYTNHETILNKTRKCQLPIFKELPIQIEKLPYSDLAQYVKTLIQEDGL
jgi:cellulose biosynthesis protein BcsQ